MRTSTPLQLPSLRPLCPPSPPKTPNPSCLRRHQLEGSPTALQHSNSVNLARRSLERPGSLKILRRASLPADFRLEGGPRGFVSPRLCFAGRRRIWGGRARRRGAAAARGGCAVAVPPPAGAARLKGGWVFRGALPLPP